MNYAGHLLAAVALAVIATACTLAPEKIVAFVAAKVEQIAPPPALR